jgi:hypothetical protein
LPALAANPFAVNVVRVGQKQREAPSTDIAHCGGRSSSYSHLAMATKVTALHLGRVTIADVSTDRN